MKIPIIATALLIAFSPALSPAAESMPTVYVDGLNADFPVERMEQEGVKIRRIQSAPKSRVIPAKDRDRFIRKAELEKDVKNWDAFAKDLMLIHVQILDIKRIIGMPQYKEIPRKKIEKLAKMVKEDGGHAL